jgi:hypothetical protein
MSEAAFQRPATSSSMPNPACPACYFEGCKKESSYKNMDDDRYASPRIMRIPARAFNFLNRKSCAKHKLEGWTRISKPSKMCYFKGCLKNGSFRAGRQYSCGQHKTEDFSRLQEIPSKGRKASTTPQTAKKGGAAVANAATKANSKALLFCRLPQEQVVQRWPTLLVRYAQTEPMIRCINPVRTLYSTAGCTTWRLVSLQVSSPSVASATVPFSATNTLITEAYR